MVRGPGNTSLPSSPVHPYTSDVNIRQLDPIPAPKSFLRELPLSAEALSFVQQSRQEIRDVLHGRDSRLLVIVGPCSIHDPVAAVDYARRLARLRDELCDELLIVMRVYFEKPRTTVGWKGLINDPDIDGSFNIRKGMWLARKTLIDVLEEKIPVATEFLDPITPQYISDAISWGAIGARNTESQVHRQLVSGLSMPVGFKNATDGSVKAAVDSCFASFFEHYFLSVNFDGMVISAQTRGNPDCHVILRGSSSGPNYDAESVAQALRQLRDTQQQLLETTSPTAVPPEILQQFAEHNISGVIIDAAHGNCGKDEQREIQVVRELAQRIGDGEQGILGVMMESFLEAGNQRPDVLPNLVYGKSVTDRCISWVDTEPLLRLLAQEVHRRNA